MDITTYKKLIKAKQPKIENNQISAKEQCKAFYHGNRGIRFKLGSWLDTLDFDLLSLASEKTDNDFFIFCDQIEPVYNEQLDIEEMVIRIKNGDYKVPTSNIIENWNAGYPRAGKLIEEYVLIPFERLQVIKEVIEHIKPIESIVDYYKSNHNRLLRLNVDPYYMAFYEKLKTMQHDQNEAASFILKSYEELYKKEMEYLEVAVRYSKSTPMFHSIIVSDKKVLEDVNNPFVRYVLENGAKLTYRPVGTI